MSDPTAEGPTPTGGEAPAAATDQVVAGTDRSNPERSSTPPRRHRRRGSRGGRSRTGTAGERDTNNDDVTAQEGEDRRPDELPDRPIEGRPTPAVSRSDKPKIGDSRPGLAGAAADSSDAPGGSPVERKPRRRRGGKSSGARRRSAAARESGDDQLSPIELDADTVEARKGRERKGRPVGRYLMCVHKRASVTQIAVMEGRSLVEHYVSRPSDDVSQIDGNIYLGRVQNVLPGMEAAFIDIGTPKNAVLYRGDLHYDADDLDSEGHTRQDARIEQLLRPGQTIVCQVTKNPIGHKGARLTQEVSIPGRFVVLVPNSTTYGISKRLPDDERKRLRRILDEVRSEEHGLIVRTAAEGAVAEELRNDVVRLLSQWSKIEAAVKQHRVPALLYREPDMAVRIIREEFNRNYRGVIIDDRELYNDVHEYVASISPQMADRVEFFDEQADGLALFERQHVHEQLHKALDRKVWLPSGGSLIIERTEALTVIDVNTGKNVGTNSLEETVFRNNVEAAEEIARQLRLRDIGGIIVVDFIDMEIRENREETIRTFREALARDKTRTQAFEISELGLVEMTRKRISEGLVESLSEICPTCTGKGFVLDEHALND